MQRKNRCFGSELTNAHMELYRCLWIDDIAKHSLVFGGGQTLPSSSRDGGPGGHASEPARSNVLLSASSSGEAITPESTQKTFSVRHFRSRNWRSSTEIKHSGHLGKRHSGKEFGGTQISTQIKNIFPFGLQPQEGQLCP